MNFYDFQLKHRQGLSTNVYLVIHKLYSGNRTSAGGNLGDTELETWFGLGGLSWAS